MYEDLVRVTSEMAGCNGFSIKPFEQWPDLKPEFDVVQLNQQASTMSEKQLSVFVDGEESEVEKITTELQIAELNDFMYEVFDGYLHEQISI